MKQTTLSGTGLPKRNLFVEIISALLLLFFVHSIISNYIQIQSLKNLLVFYTHYSNIVAWMIISIETIIAILLFISRTRWVGFIAVLLLSLFAGYIQLSKPDYPHNFGGIINSLTKQQQLLLYGFLCLLAIAGIVLTIIRKKWKIEVNTSQVVFT